MASRGGRKKPQYNRPKQSREEYYEEYPVEHAVDPAQQALYDAEGIRLSKVLANAGMGSRRDCEALIAEGRVVVDDVRITELGLRIKPEKHQILVDGIQITKYHDHITIALHKPSGVVSTADDPMGRPTVLELVSDREERLFHVGRLDAETQGLLLMTNDGELAQRLMHPKYQVPKTYVVTVAGVISRQAGRDLQAGIQLEDGFAKVDSYNFLDANAEESIVEVTLHQGRNRIVRRMFEAVGFPVTRLVRTQVGTIRLGDLKPGKYRVIANQELASLTKLVGM